MDTVITVVDTCLVFVRSFLLKDFTSTQWLHGSPSITHGLTSLTQITGKLIEGQTSEMHAVSSKTVTVSSQKNVGGNTPKSATSSRSCAIVT